MGKTNNSNEASIFDALLLFFKAILTVIFTLAISLFIFAQWNVYNANYHTICIQRSEDRFKIFTDYLFDKTIYIQIVNLSNDILCEYQCPYQKFDYWILNDTLYIYHQDYLEFEETRKNISSHRIIITNSYIYRPTSVGTQYPAYYREK